MGYENRQDIPVKYTWDLSAIYPNETLLEKDCAAAGELIGKIKNYEGKLNNEKSIYEFFELTGDIEELFEKAICYTHMKMDEDSKNTDVQAMRDKVLSDIAEKRLSAIREFTQFGAGFKIAMRDLEIRGAGNLLGPEQHGHMAAVGYDLYCKIVEGAVKEAKGEKEPVKIDTVVDIPVPASISTHYIPRESERLSMYKRIALIETRDDLYDVQDELIDRYGDIPEDTANLLNIALIKADCSRAGVTQLRIRDKEVRFVFDKQAPIDGAKLIAAAGNIAGARMTFGDTPSMVISRPKSDAAALYAMLPQFVYMLADCLSTN
mgnify:CR=1 FL=1